MKNSYNKASSATRETLFDVLNTSEEGVLARLNQLGFTSEDTGILQELGQNLEPFKLEIAEALFEYTKSCLSQMHLGSDVDFEKIQLGQALYFETLTSGNYGRTYLDSRIKVGLMHQELGLKPEWYLFSVNKYVSLLVPYIMRMSDHDVLRTERCMDALRKIVFFDIGIALDAYFYADKLAINKIALEHNHNKEKLNFHKNYDALTGLPNRAMLRHHLARVVQYTGKMANSVALIQLGIDHFRMVNEVAGVSFGDQILKSIGGRLRERLHSDDMVTYYGGDTFIIVIKNIGKPAILSTICQRICDIIREPFQTGERQMLLSCSMGVALYPNDCANLDDLFKFADRAYCVAKEKGGNNFQFFDAKADAFSLERVSIANELYTAIEQDQFCMYYQPVADLQTGQIVAMEALIRWIHPVRGMIAPMVFIPIAEELPLINKLGMWIIRRVCHDILAWQQQGLQVPGIAINVSPRQLQDISFAENLMGILAETGVDPGLITLEITESVLMNYDGSIESMLKKFKNQGIRISMDDFGTGYSALGYLKHLHFDYVKIDQSFVRDILVNQGDAAIANAIISMAHNLGIKVIAEGVETEEQCDFLSRNMCDMVQGYYLSKPMPPELTREYLRRQFVLPEHLLRIKKVTRTLLLVDDEPNILASLKRLFRRDGYEILVANGGEEGLEILKSHHVDVIISDQRMPVMTGVEFLRRAKSGFPDTIRIVLSGYTELQYITDAINEGSIYKFLTKPWDDDQLRNHILDAFEYKEMSDENRTLGLRIQTANQELASANRQLTEILHKKNKQIDRDEISLDIARETLQNIPIPMMGIDDDGMIAFINSASENLFYGQGTLLGGNIDDFLPGFSQIAPDTDEGQQFCLGKVDAHHHITWRELGGKSSSRGKLITFFLGESIKSVADIQRIPAGFSKQQREQPREQLREQPPEHGHALQREKKPGV